MSLRTAAALLLVASLHAAQDAPLRVHLRGGPKTHGEGEHDHPRFAAEWEPLLERRGCEVTASLVFPDDAQLDSADVLVLYAAEGASIHGDERARLERFLARGGGLVVLHDAVCGDDPLWFMGVAGGAWEHGRSKWHEGEIGLVISDREHPITRGASNFDFTDEIYWDLHLDPAAHVLANAFHTPFDVTPQMWTLEKSGYRAFVSIQGHEWRSFSHPAWRTLLLRGIAWAGKRDADLLVTPEEVAALRYPPGGPRAPERAHEAIVVHPDFRLSLVAAEPLVVNPISLDWDARGRMWVALTPGYPFKEESSGVAAHDEIVILADRDGDGRMDERAVFADGLDLVTSLVHHGDGVIVAQSPEILLLRDRDGDDRADERVVLFSGFGYADTHAVVSNLRWGPDGWVYATQGYSGNASRNVLGKDGKDPGPIGNGLFRFRPDGSAIEMVSAYGSNTWGLDFGADGELLFTMANGSHLRHVVMPERALAAGRMGKVESWLDVTDHADVRPLRSYDRAPYQQIDFVGGFTAASGSCLYTGGAWPGEYDGNHFTCEPTVNLVHRDALRPRGVTFTASKAREDEFAASADLWFRPVHLRVGPDGALYVLDFYNQAAVHNDTRGPRHGPTNAAVRPDRDHAHGRIWRIQHRAATPAPVPPLAEADAVGLVDALAHPNGWVRGTAQRLLVERGRPAPATLAALRTRALSAPAVPGRIAALWAFARVAPQELSEVGRAALRDPDPAVRTNALRALDTLDAWGLARALPRAETLLDERDPRARLAALVLARRILPESAYRPLIRLFVGGASAGLGDDWSRSAVLAIASERPARFVEAALEEAGPPELDALLAALGAVLVRRGDLGAAVAIVTTLGERRTTVPGPALALLGELARLDAGATPWPSPQLDRALVRLLASPHPAVAIAALPICARWSRSRDVADARAALGERLAELVEDPDVARDLRLGALAAMLALPDRQERGAELAALFLDPSFPPDVQVRVIEMLGDVEDVSSGARALCASLERLSQPARERAFAVLVARPASAAILLDALERGELRATELGPQGLHRLRTHPDAATAERASALLERLVGGERDDKDALVAELAPLVDRPGDPVRGRELFAQNCGNCHTAEGVGRGGVGPDLTGMGTHGARELLPFLLDPNRAVEPAYLEYVVETVDGELVDGVIARETADSLLLRNSAGEREVARRDVAELYSTGRSPMPVGFETLGADGLRDLLSFLAGSWSGFRVIDLRPYCTSSASRGLYDTRHDARPMRFREHGIVGVEGVPFELLDPARMADERNALTLRGGMADGWESRSYPQRVEIPLGYALARLHVLGGIAAWGHPFTRSRSPVAKLTWVYADGEREERVLVDGTEIADWIGRHEVPGSRWVDVLAEGSWGQARTFAVEPARKDGIVERIVLESFDNHLAPTFLALTAQLAGEDPHAGASNGDGAARVVPVPQVLVFGGGSSHDYERWFRGADVETLGGLGKVVAYSDDPAELAHALGTTPPRVEVLVLANNQPLPDPALRAAILAFVEGGGGLVLVHAATWYNWADWPEYNRLLAGGGARSHEDYGDFGVRIVAEHPVTAGVPRSFTVADELYRFEPDAGVPGDVLAVGRSLATDAEYPVAWTRSHGAGRIVALTLGHDGAAHGHAAYRKLLANAVAWVMAR